MGIGIPITNLRWSSDLLNEYSYICMTSSFQWIEAHIKKYSLGKQPIWHNSNNNIYIYIYTLIYIIYISVITTVIREVLALQETHWRTPLHPTLSTCHQGSTGPTGNPMTNPFTSITFDLSSGKYWPHRKPTDEPLYIQHFRPVIREVLALQETQWRTPLHPSPSTCHQGSTGPTGNPMTDPSTSNTFDLSSGKYWPYRKPNDEPLYTQHLRPVIREVLALQETQWRTPLHPSPSTCHQGSTGPTGNPMMNPSTSMQSPVILPMS